jgi:glucose-1-phosphate cytidylyltransferase
VQVVILCGGMGTRIRDVADDIPKPMIPIGGRPILWHIMKGYAHQGFTQFILCLGYKGWVIKRYFLDYRLDHSDLTVDLRSPGSVAVHDCGPVEDWQVTLVDTGLDTMTGGRLKRVEKYLAGDHFLLTYGDGVSDVNVPALVRSHLEAGKQGTVTVVPPPSRFGEVELDGNAVVEFNEKPVQTRGLINGGYFVFHRAFLDRLGSHPGLVLEREPLMDLARDGELNAHVHHGFWQCMDNNRDYQLLNQLWASGQAPWAAWAAPPLRVAA